MNITEKSIYFWSVLEKDMNIIFPNYVKNILNICGFSNPGTMECLDINKIADLEKSVKEQFAVFVEDDSFKTGVLEQIDGVHIFGFYEKNLSRFAFFPGHKADIANIAGEVKKHGKDYYNMPVNYKVPKKSFVRSSVGYLYGEKRRTQNNSLLGVLGSTQTQTTQSNLTETAAAPGNLKEIGLASNELTPNTSGDEKTIPQIQIEKSKLIVLISSLLESFYVSVADDDINLMSNGAKVSARVICKLCVNNENRKEITVQYEQSRVNSRFYWNTSNYGKHLTKQHSSSEMKIDRKRLKTNESPAGASIPDELTAAFEIYEDSSTEQGAHSLLGETDLALDSCKTTKTQDFFTELIVHQITEQNKMLASDSKLKTHEVIEFQLNDYMRTIGIVETKKDGNCLFSALVHQIHGSAHKPGSRKNLAAAKKLRKNVVKQIQANFDFYKYQLHGRLYEERDTNGLVLIDDLDKQSRDFVSEHLAMDNTFGGAETIKAISNIHKVNIIVFSENEKCSFYFEFISGYDRTVAVAHRFDQQQPDKPSYNRNHFDSISGVGERIVFDISVALAKIEMYRCSLNQAGRFFVELLSK